MPWTTAPPTYRSIPSLSPSASPSESEPATSLRPPGSFPSPTAWKERRLSRQDIEERAREAAQLDRDAVEFESRHAPCPRIALASGTQHLSGREGASSARSRLPRRPSAHACSAAATGIPELPGTPGVSPQLSPGPRASEATDFPTWDEAPRLGTPCLRDGRAHGRRPIPGRRYCGARGPLP